MRQKTIVQLVIAIAFLGAVLSAYALWYRAVGKMSVEAAALAEEIRLRSEDSARVAAAKEALASLAEDEESVRRYLVHPNEIVGFLERLEEMGRGVGAAVDVVSVSAEPGPGRGRILLSIKITGSFDSVLRALGAIEYGPYDSALTSLTFDTVPGADGDGWTAAATFTIGTQATSTPAVP